MTDHMRLLHEFVAMYGSRCTMGLQAYRGGGAPVAVLGTLADPPAVRPDMPLLTMSEQDVLRHAHAQGRPRPGLQGTLAQFRSLDPSTQTLLGLLFPDGEILTFVVAVQAVPPR